MQIRLTLISGLLFLFSCSQPKKQENKSTPLPIVEEESVVDSIPEKVVKEVIDDTAFVNIKNYSDQFAYDMRYATNNNFLNETVYECDNCLMRYEVAKALIKANDSLIKLGYRIMFYDCFRPLEVQKKMWKIIPDGRYVANPSRGGSIHNKGAAIDITLLTLNDSLVDMGTDFDHFGKEAHHDYTELSHEILQNRQLLKGIMESFGFSAIATEWWHYIYGKKSKYPVSDQALCE